MITLTTETTTMTLITMTMMMILESLCMQVVNILALVLQRPLDWSPHLYPYLYPFFVTLIGSSQQQQLLWR